MFPRARSPLSLRSSRPSLRSGALVALVAIALETLAIYPLKRLAPVVSLGVVYLIAVVLLSTYWGIVLGLLTALLSALVFNYFQLTPVGRLTLADQRNWAALGALVAVAAVTGAVAELARARAVEAERRRREADLATEMARLLLGGEEDIEAALALAAQRLAGAIGASSVAIERNPIPPDPRHVTFALRDGDVSIGTLVLPATLSDAERERVSERIVPALQSVLAAALRRAELAAEVVETGALRRSDELKTALLRSVSHDLRSPITAVLSAATAIEAHDEATIEAREVIIASASRLARLVEKLLDLSRLQGGHLEHRRISCSLEEILDEAIEHAEGDRATFRLSLDPQLPPLLADPVQLERAFANLLENAARHSAGKAVSIRARAVSGRMRIRIVDQGPGIRASERERIFLPFYRSPGAAGAHAGAGLGLAIAKGFIEAAGGRISVESLPGQGTSFVVELPIEERATLEQLAG